jgi:hypothetical protein
MHLKLHILAMRSMLNGPLKLLGRSDKLLHEHAHASRLTLITFAWPFVRTYFATMDAIRTTSQKRICTAIQGIETSHYMNTIPRT